MILINLTPSRRLNSDRRSSDAFFPVDIFILSSVYSKESTDLKKKLAVRRNRVFSLNNSRGNPTISCCLRITTYAFGYEHVCVLKNWHCIFSLSENGRKLSVIYTLSLSLSLLLSSLVLSLVLEREKRKIRKRILSLSSREIDDCVSIRIETLTRKSRVYTEYSQSQQDWFTSVDEEEEKEKQEK